MMRKAFLTGKYLEYFNYIEKHILLVKDVWEIFKRRFNMKPFINDDYNYWTLKRLVDSHDESKFSEAEFYGYRRKFYPEKGEKDDIGGFEYAWNHHQKSNPHHWEHWVSIKGNKTTALNMPMIYVLEMLIDWTAMSLVRKNIPSEWYQRQRSKMMLSSETQIRIDYWISVFDGIYSQMVESEGF